jgi:hypothetical protein
MTLTSSKQKEAVITSDMIRSWTSLDIKKVSGAKINGTANAILLRADSDKAFGEFKLWFDSTVCILGTIVPPTRLIFLQGYANVYTVSSNLNLEYVDQLVTFNNNDTTENIDLPDPQILKIHAAFCRVFYASGAADCFDDVRRYKDDTGVLSADGSSNLDLLVNLSLVTA